MKQKLVPFSAYVPSVGCDRIRQEARRRHVSIGRVITDLVLTYLPGGRPDVPATARDPRLERDGFRYADVDWSDNEMGCGVILAELAMRYLPPSRRELQ